MEGHVGASSNNENNYHSQFTSRTVRATANQPKSKHITQQHNYGGFIQMAPENNEVEKL